MRVLLDNYCLCVYNISIESEVSNMPRTAREIIKLLKKNGFIKVSQNGSHAKYKNFETGNITIVPMHKGDMPKGTEDDILKKAGLK